MFFKVSLTRVLRPLLLLPGILFLISGCSNVSDNYQDKQAEELYTMALKSFKEKEYSKAAELFEEVERQHPYSNWAVQSQKMYSYCYYEEQKYQEAIEGFKNFIQLHPSHKDVAYAYYMLGLCHFEQMPKTSERDQQPAQESLATFKILLSRFPQSAYAKDAENKVQIISNKLAAKELSVGRFYQSKGNFIAAINRFQVILTNFGKTAYVPEALHRMVESYLSTGLIEEAKQAATQLNTQYKGNEWTGYANKILSERGVQLNLSAPATIVDKNQINKNQTNKDGSQVVNPLDVKNKNTQPSIKNPSPKASSAMPKNASGKKAAQKPIKTAAKKVTKKAKTKAPKKKLKSQNTAQTAVPQTVVAAKEQANKTEMVDF